MFFVSIVQWWHLVQLSTYKGQRSHTHRGVILYVRSFPISCSVGPHLHTYWVSDACNTSNSMKNKYCHFRCKHNCEMTRHWSNLASTQLALSHKKNNPVGFFVSGHKTFMRRSCDPPIADLGAAMRRFCDRIMGAAMRRSCDPPIHSLSLHLPQNGFSLSFFLQENKCL